MKVFACVLIMAVATSVARGQIMNVSYTDTDAAVIPGGDVISHTSAGPTFQDTFEHDWSTVTAKATQNTNASATASTIDVTTTLSSETDVQQNGTGATNAACDTFFVLTQPCYFTATGNFTADSETNSSACGFLLLQYYDGYAPYPQYLSFFGEGDFRAYPNYGTPGHSGTYMLLLQPGSYTLQVLASCAGPGPSTYGTNGKATATVTVHITGAPTTAPQLTITPAGQRSANITLLSRSGLSYQLQGADDLSQWSNIGSAQAGTGSTISFPVSTAPTGSTTRFFYRVIVSFTGGSNGTSNVQKPNHALQRTEAGHQAVSDHHA